MRMTNKALLYTLAALAVAAGAYFLYSGRLEGRLDGIGSAAAPADSGIETYRLEALGISFDYPSAVYDVQTHQEGTVALLPAGFVPPQDGEGPPSITITSLDNAGGLALEEFLKKEPRTNFALSDQKLSTTTVGGRLAYAYSHSGLYETDAVAVATGEKVYVFAAGWMQADDRIRQDFKDIIKSVKFQ